MKNCLSIIKTILFYTRKPISNNPILFVSLIVLLRPMVLTEHVVDYISNYASPNYHALFFLYIRDFIFTVFISYIATIITQFTGVCGKILFYSIGGGLFLVSIFLSLTFGRVISAMTIQQLLETNSSEATEFFSLFVLSKMGMLSIIITIATTITIILAEKKWHTNIKIYLQNQNHVLKSAFSLLIIATICISAQTTLFGALNVKLKWTQPKFNSISLLINSITTLRDNANKTALIFDYSEKIANQKTDLTLDNPNNINVIFILGESFIKSHSSLYKYNLRTNPLLEKELSNGNLFLFNDVITPFNSTIEVVRNVFFCNSISDGQDYSNSPFFPQIFKKHGFCVYMCDCQRNYYATDNNYNFTDNSILHGGPITRNSYDIDFESKQVYDRDIISEFFKSLPTICSKNLFIFHLKGQHLPASSRFPHNKEYLAFSASDITNSQIWLNTEKKESIAMFDNATYYNDFVIHDIIEQFRDSNSAIIYCSDHGEEIYDYRDSKGRVGPSKGMEKEWAHSQFNVPFMLWFSDTYKELNKDIITKVESSLNKPYTIDHLSNLLFNIAGIKTQFYNPKYDIISDHFTFCKRTISDADHTYVFDYDCLPSL